MRSGANDRFIEPDDVCSDADAQHFDHGRYRMPTLAAKALSIARPKHLTLLVDGTGVNYANCGAKAHHLFSAHVQS